MAFVLIFYFPQVELTNNVRMLFYIQVFDVYSLSFERKKMEANRKQLEEIASAIVSELRTISDEACSRMFLMENLRESGKARFPESFLVGVLVPHGFMPNDIQIEMSRVSSKFESEVRSHEKTDTLCVVMGETVRFPNPLRAHVHLDGEALTLNAGDKIIIPAGITYGFTATGGGTLHFLSVQSPPIVND